MQAPPARVALALLCAIAFASFGCVDRASEHRVRGNAHFRRGDYAGALAEYEQALAARPRDAATLALRGNALFELGRLDEAHAAFSASLGVDPKGPDALLGIALVSARRNDLPAAAAHFERLLALSGHEHDTTTRVNLAKLYLAMGKLESAEAQAVEAGHEQGRDEQVLFTLGRVYLAAGKLAEADATFAHLVEVAPSRASGPYGLAMVAARRGDREGALARLAQAVGRGLPEVEAVASEPSFASLKDDPAFVRLAARR